MCNTVSNIPHCILISCWNFICCRFMVKNIFISIYKYQPLFKSDDRGILVSGSRTVCHDDMAGDKLTSLTSCGWALFFLSLSTVQTRSLCYHVLTVEIPSSMTLVGLPEEFDLSFYYSPIKLTAKGARKRWQPSFFFTLSGLLIGKNYHRSGNGGCSRSFFWQTLK